MADVFLCCHFGLARNLSEKKVCPGVKARDKWFLDEIEEKQEKILGAEGREGLAATDKGKKDLKTVLCLVRKEVENLQDNCGQYGVWQLKIMTKNGGIIGGWVNVQDTGFFFNVEKKKKNKKMAITVERPDSTESVKELWKEGKLLNSLVKATQTFSLTIPLRCGLNCSGASCQPRLKEARYRYLNSSKPNNLKPFSGYQPSLGSLTVPASAGLNSFN